MKLSISETRKRLPALVRRVREMRVPVWKSPSTTR